jgi:hypothetical protein
VNVVESSAIVVTQAWSPDSAIMLDDRSTRIAPRAQKIVEGKMIENRTAIPQPPYSTSSELKEQKGALAGVDVRPQRDK